MERLPVTLLFLQVRAPSSVLWLIQPRASVQRNLEAAAAAAGVARQRLVFAPLVEHKVLVLPLVGLCDGIFI